MFRLNLYKEISAYAKYHFSRLSDDEQGSAILYAMLLVSVLFLLGGAVTNTMVYESRDAYQVLHQTQAFYLAEAGMERASYEQAANNYTGSMQTGDYSVDVVDWIGDGLDNDNNGTADDMAEAGYYTIESTGTVGGETVTLKSVALGASEAHELFYHHAIYVANTSGDPAYTFELAGVGGDADDIDGDIYVNGNIDVTDNATVTTPEPFTDQNGNGEWDEGEPYTDENASGFYDFGIEATGAIAGVPGVAGNSPVINPPEIWNIDYQGMADVDVAYEFSIPANIQWKTNSGVEPGMNSPVETVVDTNDAHIFAKGILPGYGPVGTPDNENYFLGDWHEGVLNLWWYVYNGQKITVAASGNENLYYVDGNVWIETNGLGPTLYSQSSTVGTEITIVAKGNIYIADELLYERKWLDGICMLAITDGESYTDKGNGVYDAGELYDDLNVNGVRDAGEPYIDNANWQYDAAVDDLHDYGADGIDGTSDGGEGNGFYDGNVENSGNIFLGDPNLGPIGEVNAFLYAQNDFVDYVLNDAGDPEDFEIYGTMSAGNQVRINRARDYSGADHTKMEVIFDNRLREATLELPGLPPGQNRIIEGNAWGMLSWHH